MAELERQIFGYEVSAFAIMSKALFRERDLSAFGALARWLRMRAPQVLRWVRTRQRGLAFDPLPLQLKGAIQGPRSYRAALKGLPRAA